MEFKFKERLPYFLLALYIGVAHIPYVKFLVKFDTIPSVYFVSIGILLISVLGMCITPWVAKKPYWGVTLFLLLLEQYLVRLYCLNSSYLYKYFTIGVFLSFQEAKGSEQKVFLGKVARLLLCVTFLFASLQKIVSEYYREGNQVGEILIYSKLFQGILLKAGSPLLETFQHLIHAYKGIKFHPPGVEQEVKIEFPQFFVFLGCFISVSSIALEFILAILCSTKKLYNRTITFVMSLALVVGIYGLVNELLFLALICLLSYYSLECEGRKAKVFLLSFFYFIIVFALDFRPSFLN